MPNGPGAIRYRFGEFVLSPRRRTLVRSGVPVPLIPKYFDLLRLLVERRPDALDRREIFDRIWADVVVSDGALSQAIRTLRRALSDDPRTPRYIRTVSRHGYQFVFEPVVIEDDDVPANAPAPSVSPRVDASPDQDAQYDVLIRRVLGAEPFRDLSDDDRRDAAEQLHTLGTRAALERLATKPGHAAARALMRDARWDVAGAGEVPLVGAPDAAAAVVALMALRLRSAARAIAARIGAAGAGGAIAGILGGVTGGLILTMPYDSPETLSTIAALTIIGATAGAFGAAGVGSGLAAAEALARSRRAIALAVCGAVSGCLAGAIVQVAVRVVFASVVGRPPSALGGPLEGLIMGLAAGIGYASSTPTARGGGMAAPRGSARVNVALATAICCAAAGALLAATGAKTVSVTLDTLSDTYANSRVGLAPLARLLGEHELRPVTRLLVSAFEGLLFGFGLGFGLTHRPSFTGRSGRSGS